MTVEPDTFKAWAISATGRSFTLDISCVPGPPPVVVDTFAISAFGKPVDAGVLNLANAGRTIPFKFAATLNGEPVLDLTNAEVTVIAKPFDCAATDETGDAVEAYATNATGLQSFGDGTYQLNMKTNKAWSGCYRLGLKVRDVTQTEDFKF